MQVLCLSNLYAALLVAILIIEPGLQTWTPIGTGVHSVLTGALLQMLL